LAEERYFRLEADDQTASAELVRLLYAASIAPDGVENLLAAWERETAAANGQCEIHGSANPMALLARPGLAAHVVSAAEVIDRISTSDEAGVDQNLSAIRGPAMLLDAVGMVVLGANAAAVSLGARRHQPLDSWPAGAEQRRDFAVAFRKFVAGETAATVSVTLGRYDQGDVVIGHLSRFAGVIGREAVLLIVSGFHWQERTETLLRSAFQLTGVALRETMRMR
jgi:hypothetical protein